MTAQDIMDRLKGVVRNLTAVYNEHGIYGAVSAGVCDHEATTLLYLKVGQMPEGNTPVARQLAAVVEINAMMIHDPARAAMLLWQNMPDMMEGVRATYLFNRKENGK